MAVDSAGVDSCSLLILRAAWCAGAEFKGHVADFDQLLPIRCLDKRHVQRGIDGKAQLVGFFTGLYGDNNVGKFYFYALRHTDGATGDTHQDVIHGRLAIEVAVKIKILVDLNAEFTTRRAILLAENVGK